MTGLRAQKKAEVRRHIAHTALELAVERGPDAVSVDDIAAAAGVSPRTVFNHFGTKDQAIIGVDESGAVELADEVAGLLTEMDPARAIGAAVARRMSASSENGRFWLARAQLVAQHPHLHAAMMASQRLTEAELTGVVADHLGLDPERHDLPALLVAAVMAALRATLARHGCASPETLRRALRDAADLVAHGFAPSDPPGAR